MVKKVMGYCKKYHMIRPHDTIVAGISGGADSVCLLFVLLEMQKQIPFQIRVVHVNHGIREDAGEDAQFVDTLCSRYKMPFYLVEEKVKERAKQSGLSEEEEGRLVRYQAFERVLGEAEGRIAVAHNSNDRAETMLFHLFRGTGLTGASGIRPVNGKIIRPLLCVTRKEIETWLTQQSLSFCQDSTNEQDFYTRNRIRHHILPYAEKQICRGAVVNMNRAADDLLGAEEFISRMTKQGMKRCVKEREEGELLIDLPVFAAEDDYLKGRILLSCLEKVAGSKKDLTAAHVRGVERLFQGTGSKQLQLPYEIVVYKKYDLGIIKRNVLSKSADSGQKENRKEYVAPVPGEIMVPGLGRVEFAVFSGLKSQNIPEKTYTKWFDYDKITSSVMFRTKRPGDYLTIRNKEGMGHKSLQDYFVNEKIPKEERPNIFLLAEQSHILWIPGHRISEYYKVNEATRTILQVTIPAMEEKIQKEERSHQNGRKN